MDPDALKACPTVYNEQLREMIEIMANIAKVDPRVPNIPNVAGYNIVGILDSNGVMHFAMSGLENLDPQLISWSKYRSERDGACLQSQRERKCCSANTWAR